MSSSRVFSFRRVSSGLLYGLIGGKGRKMSKILISLIATIVVVVVIVGIVAAVKIQDGLKEIGN